MPVQGAFQLNIETQGRLIDPRQFGNIVVRTDPDGRVTRVRDIGRVELAAQDYGTNGYLDERPAVPLLIFQRPGSNALATAERIMATMKELSASFPTGLRYDIVYNPTEFIAESVNEVIKTIFEAVALVVIVVILFLQTWRASIVPIVAIPVSLIGTFTVLAAMGYSLNTLSLFGLVLAIGIVVDDAIVVVENVERNLRAGMSPREASHRTMDEVGGALIAIALVLTAVFIPAAFVSGISGQFFRQFAVTIAAATVISCFVSLTLSPALCALLFKPHDHEAHKKSGLLMRPVHAFFNGFNRVFDGLASGYGGMTRRFVRLPLIVLSVYGLLLLATGWQFNRAPTGFIPNQDQGYLITVIQLPPGSSLSRTDAVVREATKIILETEGIDHAVPFAGFDGATFTNASNAGAIFSAMAPFEERLEHGLTADRLQRDLIGRLSSIKDAFIITIPPPPVRGIGNSGGFKMMVQDKRGRGAEVAGGGDAGDRGRRQRHDRSGQRLLPVQHQHAQGLCRHRPAARPDARRFGRAGVRDAGGLSGLDLRQRVQLSWPNLPGDRPGGRLVPRRSQGHRQPEDPQRAGRDGADRLGRGTARHHRPVPRDPLQPLSLDRDPGRHPAGLLDRLRAGCHGTHRG